MSTETVTAGATGLARVRMRPVVHASPTPDGVHLRGWSSSVTVTGSAALWRVWEALSVRLADGVPEHQLRCLSRRPDVQAAIDTLLVQLREHDMLVTLAEDWPPRDMPADTATWFESVAADPGAAWSRLRGRTVRVEGSGPVVVAATRAVHDTGLATEQCGGPARLRLVLGGCGVTADAHDTAGYVLPPGSCAQAPAVAEAIGLGAGDPPAALAGIVGGAAAHRLICAVAGLPDPGGDTSGVLVARLDPLRAEYHPHPLPESVVDTDMEQALDRLDALTDTEIGPVTVVAAHDLPQTPAGLSCLDVGGRQVVGVGATLDAARLQAGLLAAEQLAAGPGLPAASVTAGCDELEAAGRWLRRRIGPGAAALPDRVWCEQPVARRWWKALTLRLGVRADVSVSLVSPQVWHAAVRSAGRVIGSAVEGDPADAAAYALLAAVGLVQWEQDGRAAPVGLAAPCGAAPEPAATALSWQDRSWTWPAGSRATEPDFQRRLRGLVGDALPPPRHAAGHVLVVDPA